jgi:hypothetical protein
MFQYPHYCRGGSLGTVFDNPYTWNSATPLTSSQWINTAVSRAIIQEMNIGGPSDGDWAFLGYCAPGQLYAGFWNDALYRTFAIGSPIQGGDDAPGILFQQVTLAPGQSNSVQTCVGVTNSHAAAEALAASVCPCALTSPSVGGQLFIINKLTTLAPWIALVALISIAGIVTARRVTKKRA